MSKKALFRQLDEEITQFIEGLSIASTQMDKIHATSVQISGQLHIDFLKLQKDLKKVIQDSIRIKHEAREL